MSVTGLVAKAASVRVVVALSLALVAVSSIAGWSLWRLASAHTRCDLRIAQAQARGSAAVQALVAGQESAMALLKAEDDARLLALQSAIPARQTERVTVYRDRVRTVALPECRVSTEQVRAINEALR